MNPQPGLFAPILRAIALGSMLATPLSAQTGTGAGVGSVGEAGSDNILLTSASSFAPGSPWMTGDIGSPGLAGQVRFASGLFSIYGGGLGLTGTADSFRYVYQALNGNGVAIAKVDSLSATTASAGVVMRQNLTAGPAEAAVQLNAAHGISFVTRAASGGSISTTAGLTVSAPYWVKLVRAGSLFSGYESPDGVTWTLVGSQTISMSGSIYSGLSTTSGNNSTLALADLSNVQLLPAGGYLVNGAIASGASHNLYLETGGTVWAWGLNTNGQVGNGTTATQLNPVPVLTTTGTALSGIAAVSGGGSHSLALGTDGTLWAWGNNASGQLGDGSTNSKTMAEHLSSSVLSGMASISAGFNHSLALGNDGFVRAWGDDTWGEIGDNAPTITPHPAPYLIQTTGVSNITSVQAGQYFSLALRNDGTVFAWGDDSSGQLGNGMTGENNFPVEVPNFSGAVALSAGILDTLAITTGGTIWAWGDNSTGELGNGTTTGSLVPITTTPGVPAISSPLVATGTVGAAFIYQITGSHNPVSFSTSTLPAGLTLSASGEISGKPMMAGTSSVTISASNLSGTGSATLKITISASGSSLPVTLGLVGWYHADSGVVTAAGTNQVTTWQDGSTNHFDVSQSDSATEPTLGTDPSTGTATVQFNGSQFLANDGASLSAVNDCTIVAVSSTPSPSTMAFGTIAGVGQGYSTTDQRSLLYDSNFLTFSTGTDPVLQDITLYLGGMVPQVATLVSNVAVFSSSAHTVKFYTNGVLNPPAVSAVHSVQVGTGVAIGSDEPYGNFLDWTGNISEVIIYDRALTATELQELQNYLAAKYSLNP